MSKILKICPYCGKQIPEGTKVCPVCKRSLNLPPPVEKKPESEKRKDRIAFEMPEPDPAAPAENPQKPGLSKGAIAMLVIAVVVLVAAIVVLVTVLTGNGQALLPNQSVANNTPSPTFSVPLGEPTVTPEPTAEPTATPEPTPDVTAESTEEPTASPEQTSSPDGTLITPVSDSVWVKGNNVNVRSGPGTEYESLGSLSTGTQLDRSGTTENGWSRITYDGQTAYVYNELLSTSQVTESTAAPLADTSGFLSCSDTVTIKSEANIRSGPSTDDSVVGVAKVGTTLTRTGVSAKWSKVTYNGETCYVHNNMITASAGSDGFTVCSDTVTIKSEANIRSGPSTDDSVVGVAKVGTTLTRTGVSSKWSKVTYNGQTCYVHNNMLQ